MTCDEVEDWVTYLNKRGTFNLGLRMEAGFALVAWMIARGFKLVKDNNVAYTMEDFMLHTRRDEEDKELTFEEAIKAFQRIGSSKNG